MNRATRIMVLASSVCAGCASAPPAHDPAPVERIDGPTIYARLVATPAGYRFDTLSIRHHSDREPWIRLNNLSPAFNTALEKDCELGTTIVGELHVKPTCKTLNPALFRVDRMTGGQQVEKAITTVWTAGTMGTSRTTTVGVDAQAYRHAVGEAVSALGMDRAEVVRAFTALNAERTSIEQSNAGLRARARPRVEVIDASGFYTAGSVDFSGDVEVKAPHLEDIADIPLGGKLSRGDLEAAFDSGARRAWTSNHQLFTLTCAAGMKQSFNFTMECPATANADELVAGIPVTVHVLSKVVTHLIPRAFVARDKVLTISLDGNGIQLVNDSNDFVTVTSVTVYYSGKTYTIEAPHPLPPHSKLERPLDLYEFRRHLPGADRPTLTYADAAQSAINFGLAARYTRNSNTATVYREEQYTELGLSNQSH